MWITDTLKALTYSIHWKVNHLPEPRGTSFISAVVSKLRIKTSVTECQVTFYITACLDCSTYRNMKNCKSKAAELSYVIEFEGNLSAFPQIWEWLEMSVGSFRTRPRFCSRAKASWLLSLFRCPCPCPPDSCSVPSSSWPESLKKAGLSHSGEMEAKEFSQLFDWRCKNSVFSKI